MAQLGPVAGVGAVGGVGQGEAVEEGGVEAGLQGADGHPLAVGGLVHVVPGDAAVEQVHPALVAPQALGHQHQRHGQQRGHAVHDGGVDHLAVPGRGPLDQGRADAVGHDHSAAAEVAEQVGGELGPAAGAAQRVQGAGAGDVADVVPGRGGQRAVLAPAGHPGVHQPRVAGQASLRADAHPLGHSRPEALEQHVGGVDEAQHGRPPLADA